MWEDAIREEVPNDGTTLESLHSYVNAVYLLSSKNRQNIPDAYKALI